MAHCNKRPVKPKGAAENKFSMLSRRGHQYRRCLWWSRTAACFSNSQGWVYPFNQIPSPYLCQKKKKMFFFCPAQLCRVQGQRRPNVVSNLILLYRRHHIFLAKPCNKPSLNWCSTSLTHSSQPEQPLCEQLSAYQRKISLQIPKPLENSPDFASDKQDNACPADAWNLPRRIALENGALCSNLIKKVFGKMISASQSSVLSGVDTELCML